MLNDGENPKSSDKAGNERITLRKQQRMPSGLININPWSNNNEIQEVVEKPDLLLEQSDWEEGYSGTSEFTTDSLQIVTPWIVESGDDDVESLPSIPPPVEQMLSLDATSTEVHEATPVEPFNLDHERAASEKIIEKSTYTQKFLATQNDLRRSTSLNSFHSSKSASLSSSQHFSPELPSKIVEEVIQEGISTSNDFLIPEDMSTDSAITFYQGFRAVYPKLAPKIKEEIPIKPLKSSLVKEQISVSKRQSSPSIGLGLAKKYRDSSGILIPNIEKTSTQHDNNQVFDFDEKQGNLKKKQSLIRLQGSSVTNITRMFSELIEERDVTLAQSDKLEEQRLAITRELRQIEDLMLEMKRRKLELNKKLGTISERETIVNDTLEELETRISSIGLETNLFEKRVRGIKADSIEKVVNLKDSDEDNKKEGFCSMTFYGHADSIESLSTDHAFGTLASCSRDKSIRLYDLSSFRCSAELLGHSGWVRCSILRSTSLFTGSSDHEIRLWDLTQIPPLSPLDKPMLTNTTSPSLPSFQYDARKKVKPLSDDEEDEEKQICSFVFKGHTAAVLTLWYENGIMCSGSFDKDIRQWDVNVGKCLSVLKSDRLINRDQSLGKVDGMLYGQVDQLAVTHQNNAVEGIFGDVSEIWGIKNDLLTNITQPIFSSKKSTKPIRVANVGGAVGALQFWQHALAAGYGDGIVRLFDLRSGECNRQFGDGVTVGHSGSILSLRFDDNYIVTGSVDETVKIWDIRTGSIVNSIYLTKSVTSLTFDNRRVLVAAGGKHVQLFNRSTGKLSDVGGESGHGKGVMVVEGAGDRIFSGSLDGVVKLWKG